MLKVEGLTIGFDGALAVREAALGLEKGERVGIVGESGSGKSMFALSLLGMVPDAARVSGAIDLNGTAMGGAGERDWQRKRGRDVAMIFQEPMAALNPLMRVGDILAEPLMVHMGQSRREAQATALGLLEEVGIPDPQSRLLQYPHELSGGQRQRVLIALALTCGPSLLIADEPTTALDVQVARRIIDLLLDLSARRQMALLFISHDLGAVARATERIVVMYGGDMVESGPTRTVLSAPAHPYTIGLLAARPSVDPNRPRRMRLPTIAGTVPALRDLAPGCRFSGRCPVELSQCAKERPAHVQLGNGHVAACHLLSEVTP